MLEGRRPRWRLLFLLALALGLGLLFWHSPLLLPLKLLSVTLHEAGHALAAYAVGGRVESIAVDRYQGGVAHCIFPQGRWRAALIASSGYLGSTLFGVLLLRLATKERSAKSPQSKAGRRLPSGPRLVLWILGLGLLLLALFFFRDLFSWLFALPTAAALMAFAWRAPEPWVRPTSIFVSAFCCLYALFALRDDILRMPWESQKVGVTDADLLSELLLLPAWFWGFTWTLIALVLVAWTLWSTILPRKVARY